VHNRLPVQEVSVVQRTILCEETPAKTIEKYRVED